jgi:hypothetical protein
MCVRVLREDGSHGLLQGNVYMYTYAQKVPCTPPTIAGALCMKQCTRMQMLSQKLAIKAASTG